MSENLKLDSSFFKEERETKEAINNIAEALFNCVSKRLIPCNPNEAFIILDYQSKDNNSLQEIARVIYESEYQDFFPETLEVFQSDEDSGKFGFFIKLIKHEASFGDTEVFMQLEGYLKNDEWLIEKDDSSNKDIVIDNFN